MNESCCFHHFVAAQITLSKFGLTELVEPRKLTGSNPEGQGFEPWDLLPGQRFSRPPRSTAPASLRSLKNCFSSAEDSDSKTPDTTSIW